MFDLSGKTALVTGATGGIGGAHRPRAAWPGRHRRALRHAPRGARCARRRTEGSRACAALRSRRQGRGRGAGAERGRENGESSTSWSPMPASTADNLFVQLSDEDWDKVIAVNLTATFRLTRAAVKTHDAPALGPRDRHYLGGRRYRQSGAGQLHRLEGGHDRHDEVGRRRIRQAQRHRQLHRARHHRQRHDRQAQRQAARGDPGQGSRRPARARRPTWRRRRSIWPPTRPPMSPGRPFTSTAAWR